MLHLTAQSRLVGWTAAFLLLVSTSVSPAAAASRKHRATVRRPAHAKEAKPAPAIALPCGDFVGFQVLLDRQGFSPGEIDGKPGINFTRALSAFQGSRKLEASGKADCATWQ